MTKTMKVLDILQTASGSCDFHDFDGSPEGWMTMIQSKGNDSGFTRLVEAILEKGWMEGSKIGFKNGYINEGHHRLVAAILLGLDEVPVTDGWDDGPRVLSAHMDISGPLGVQYF